MTRPRGRDERGAALILAIAFMLVVGGVGAALLTSVASGVNDRAVLDRVRNRQYAADGAVEAAIADVRLQGVAGVGMAGCNGVVRRDPSLNNVTIRVDCDNVPTFVAGGILQRNVVFTACLDAPARCADSTEIVRAQINYQTIGTAPPVVTRTWTQSWSVRS